MTHRLCDMLLPQVSRTFSLPIQALPEPLRAAVQTAYLLCRLVDCIEDEPALPQEEREPLFDAFDAAMSGDILGQEHLAGRRLGATVAEQRLCASAGVVFADFAALDPQQQAVIAPAVQEMSQGMREYSRRWSSGEKSTADTGDLERYCYFVAGTVGLLLDGLFSLEADSRLSAEARRPLAIEFGVGLQLVNILKDVSEDAVRGICYVPEAVLLRHQMTPTELLTEARRADGLAVLGELCALARLRLRSAARYALSWPGEQGAEVRRFCALPLLLAGETLKVIESGQGVLRAGHNPRISRRTVSGLVAATRATSRAPALRMMLHRATIL